MSDPKKYAADLARTVFYPVCSGVPCFAIAGREVPYWLKSLRVWDQSEKDLARVKAEGLGLIRGGPAEIDGQTALYFVKMFGTPEHKISAIGLIGFPLSGHVGCGRAYFKFLMEEITAECEQTGLTLLVDRLSG